MFYTFAQKHQEIHASLAKCFCKYHWIVIKKWLPLGMLFICFALPSCIYTFLKGCALGVTIHSLGREEAQVMARTVTCASTQEPVRCDQSNFLKQSYPPHSERRKRNEVDSSSKRSMGERRNFSSIF